MPPSVPVGPAIEVRDLVRTFGSRRAVDGLDLQVQPGTVMALVGSNGAGKTTFMKILATLVEPTAGLARIMGRDVRTDPAGARRRLGFVPSEERSFYWRLTIRQNLEFFASLQGVGPRECHDLVEADLAALGLLDRVDTRFGELSTGMKQSVGIIRALLHDPEVLLLDEPTRSLSPDAGQRAMALLRHLALDRGKAVLVATHNLQEAQAVAHEVAVLHRGRIRACGPLETLHRERGLPGAPSLEGLFRHLTGDGPEGAP